jgi:hypothetical protein
VVAALIAADPTAALTAAEVPVIPASARIADPIEEPNTGKTKDDVCTKFVSDKDYFKQNDDDDSKKTERKKVTIKEFD